MIKLLRFEDLPNLPIEKFSDTLDAPDWVKAKPFYHRLLKHINKTMRDVRPIGFEVSRSNFGEDWNMLQDIKRLVEND